MSSPTSHDVLLNPPRPGIQKDTRETYKYLYELWKRTGGYSSSVVDHSGLRASTAELNTLVGIRTDITVQAQLDSKVNSADLGSMAYQHANAVAITGGSIGGVVITGSSINNAAIFGGTIDNNAITNSSMATGTITTSSFTGGTIVNSTITNSSITVPIGTSGQTGRGGGTLHVDPTTHFNVGAAETDLASYLLKGDSLNTNNSYVEIHAWGTFAANANNKRVRIYMGPIVLLDTSVFPINGGVWSITGKILRSVISSGKSILELQSSNPTLSSQPYYKVIGVSFGSDLTIKATGQAVFDTDIFQEGFTVKWGQQ